MTLIHRARTFKRGIVDRRHREAIERILSDPSPPDVTAAERDFDALQAAYPPLPEYGYDAVSLMRRAAQRLSEVLADHPSADRALHFLDVGAGDGLFGALAAAGGHEVTLADLRDWRKPAAAALNFIAADCAALPIADDSIDIATSFNAFEHMADPAGALAELARVVRPGGYIHLDFGPLYYSPWGLHAYRSLMMPYPQLLFSDALIEAKLTAIGISDLGETRHELQYVNGWRPAQYDTIWQAHPVLERVSHSRHVVPDFLDLAKRYPGSFRGRGLAYDDLVVANIRVVLRKTDHATADRLAKPRG